MEPLLRDGQKLDEKVIRSAITVIVDGTYIQDRPMIDVFPDVEEYMRHNFDENGPTIYEKFGFMNL